MTYDEAIASAPVVLIEFYATWCGHCARMAPVVEQIKELTAGQASVIQLDVDTNQEAADAQDVKGTPTFILYSNGREVWRQSGEMDGNLLLAKIQSYIK